MLQDIERKILRIIANYGAGRKRMPSIHELTIKTGRTRDGIYKVLTLLANERYIEWNSAVPELIVLTEGWERDPIRPAAKSAFGEM